MKLEFGKYTDVTNLAKEVNPDYLGDYYKVYICPDTENWWLACVQKDINDDYEREVGTYLIERDLIEYDTPKLRNEFLSKENVVNVLKNRNGDFWDATEFSSFEDVVDSVDGGYGINEEE